VKYTCGAVHICSYLSLILLEEHAGFRFLLKKRPSDCSYYWLLAKPKHRQVQKIWHELVWCQNIGKATFFSFTGSKPSITLGCLTKILA